MQDEEEEAGEEGTSTPIAGGSPKPSAQAKMGGERGVHWGRGNERVPMCKDVSPRATGRPAVGTQPRRGGERQHRTTRKALRRTRWGQRTTLPPSPSVQRGTGACEGHASRREGAMLRLCKVTPQPNRCPGPGRGARKGGEGGKGKVSSTCLAAASSSPSVSCAGGRRAGSAAPAGSAPRGIWASPGNSASAGRSRTGGRRGRRRGGGGGSGAAFPPPPHVSSHPSAARFPTAGCASPPSAPWPRT